MSSILTTACRGDIAISPAESIYRIQRLDIVCFGISSLFTCFDKAILGFSAWPGATGNVDRALLAVDISVALPMVGLKLYAINKCS